MTPDPPDRPATPPLTQVVPSGGRAQAPAPADISNLFANDPALIDSATIADQHIPKNKQESIVIDTVNHWQKWLQNQPDYMGNIQWMTEQWRIQNRRFGPFDTVNNRWLQGYTPIFQLPAFINGPPYGDLGELSNLPNKPKKPIELPDSQVKFAWDASQSTLVDEFSRKGLHRLIFDACTSDSKTNVFEAVQKEITALKSKISKADYEILRPEGPPNWEEIFKPDGAAARVCDMFDQTIAKGRSIIDTEKGKRNVYMGWHVVRTAQQSQGEVCFDPPAGAFDKDPILKAASALDYYPTCIPFYALKNGKMVEIKDEDKKRLRPLDYIFCRVEFAGTSSQIQKSAKRLGWAQPRVLQVFLVAKSAGGNLAAESLKQEMSGILSVQTPTGYTFDVGTTVHPKIVQTEFDRRFAEEVKKLREFKNRKIAEWRKNKKKEEKERKKQKGEAVESSEEDEDVAEGDQPDEDAEEAEKEQEQRPKQKQKGSDAAPIALPPHKPLPRPTIAPREKPSANANGKRQRVAVTEEEEKEDDAAEVVDD